jgi:hypothetical protein
VKIPSDFITAGNTNNNQEQFKIILGPKLKEMKPNIPVVLN